MKIKKVRIIGKHYLLRLNILSQRSLTKIRNNKGPKIEPCGPPHVIASIFVCIILAWSHHRTSQISDEWVNLKPLWMSNYRLNFNFIPPHVCEIFYSIIFFTLWPSNFSLMEKKLTSRRRDLALRRVQVPKH